MEEVANGPVGTVAERFRDLSVPSTAVHNK